MNAIVADSTYRHVTVKQRDSVLLELTAKWSELSAAESAWIIRAQSKEVGYGEASMTG